MKKLTEQFLYPDKEFTPIPFWFWNDVLSEPELKRQIHDFNQKGVNGFVIHPRMGLPDSLIYMSDEFLSYVKFAVKEASALDMKVVLYDEAMYPSGSASGGVAASNPDFASKGLRRIKSGTPPELKKGDRIVYEQDGVYYVCGYTNGTIRGIHYGEDDGGPNAPKSADLLNKDAVLKFIELTHEKYFNAVGQFFGNTVIGMFTDEPCVTGRGVRQDVLPWTDGFINDFISFGGRLSNIPALWSEGIAGDIYRKALTARMEESYYKPISQWCEKHNIALMGHPENSDDIALLKHFHIPGQDVVWRWVAPEDEKGIKGAHSTQAKCSSDSARHAKKRRNSNECFGACGKGGTWDFTADDMKWYLDWLAVRGVNMILPHAFFYSVKGARRNERPPDVGPNNIWWDNYRVYSDYIKRLCWLNSGSANTAEVAVLCHNDKLDWESVATLYRNQVEFNYLEDFYLTSQNIKKGYINVNENKYRILFVPENTVLTPLQQSLLKKAGVVVVSTVDDIIKNARRRIKTESYSPDLRFSNVIKDNINFYLLVNEGDGDITQNITFYQKGCVKLFYPFEGTVSDCKDFELIGDFIKLELRLKFRQSVIVCIS